MKIAKGNLHTATCISLSRFNRSLAMVMKHVVEPVRKAHGQAQKMFSTRRGGRERQVQAASGQWLSEVASIAAVSQDEQTLKAIGFRLSANDFIGPVGQGDEEKQANGLGQQFEACCLHPCPSPGPSTLAVSPGKGGILHVQPDHQTPRTTSSKVPNA
jgi:hypothetical protein